MQEKRIQIEGQDTPYLIRDDGTVWSEKRNRILKGTVERNEYHTVYLTFNGKQYNHMVHRLVAEAFCENPNGYTIVHHKDGNKLNNHAENLEWVTTQENNLAAKRTGNIKTRKRFEGDLLKDPNWKQLENYPLYFINKEGAVVNYKTNFYMQPHFRNGYARIRIKDESGESHLVSLHRLLYETFIAPIPDNMYVDHIDGNKMNNDLSNLRLVTQSDNMKNAMTNGHKGQIPILQFDKQGNFIAEYPTIQAAADAMNVTHPAVRSALNRGGTCAGYYWKKKFADSAT